MHDVCIIYSRKDGTLPPALEKILSPEWSVWWDQKITGDFRVAIEEAIPAAKCVIPIWSAASRKSQIVIDEAKLAEKNKIPLLPILSEKGVEPPLGFGSIDSIELFGWRGEREHPGIEKLLQKLRLITPGQVGKRPADFRIGALTLPSPTFFFSVSSHETQLTPLEAVRALTLFRAEATLVSAYDIFHSARRAKFISTLKKCRAAGTVVLLDSGNYEAYRKADNKWSPAKLREVLEAAPYDFAFCFDEIGPRNNPRSMVKQVVDAVEREAKRTSKPVLPIVHTSRGRDGQYATEHLPYVMKEISRVLKPAIIGIPERELGQGIIARAKTLSRIRSELATLGTYQPLHILGTGNPLSMAILSAMGGDCFDGLEWCRVVADESTCTLHHFQQYDFFSYQTRVAQSSIAREAANSDRINYAGKVLFHNMDFFAQFVDELRGATLGEKMVRFLTEFLPSGSMRQLEEAFPKDF